MRKQKRVLTAMIESTNERIDGLETNVVVREGERRKLSEKTSTIRAMANTERISIRTFWNNQKINSIIYLKILGSTWKFK